MMFNLNRYELERFINKKVTVALKNGEVTTGILKKTGDEDFIEYPCFYKPKGQYFVVPNGDDVENASDIFRVSHIKDLEPMM